MSRARIACPGADDASTVEAGEAQRCGTCYAQVRVRRDGTIAPHTADPRRIAGALAMRAHRP